LGHHVADGSVAASNRGRAEIAKTIEDDARSEACSLATSASGNALRLPSACATVADASLREKARRGKKMMVNVAERVVPDSEPRKWLSKQWQGYKKVLQDKVDQEIARTKIWKLNLESGMRKMKERKVAMMHDLNYDTEALIK
jgi:hypothetical protein